MQLTCWQTEIDGLVTVTSREPSRTGASVTTSTVVGGHAGASIQAGAGDARGNVAQEAARDIGWNDCETSGIGNDGLVGGKGERSSIERGQRVECPATLIFCRLG